MDSEYEPQEKTMLAIFTGDKVGEIWKTQARKQLVADIFIKRDTRYDD